MAAERRAPGVSSGVLDYGLSANFCEECGRAKLNRLLMTAPSGCGTCDEVITRHRCTKSPPLDSMAVGESWTCPDCDSVWTCTEEEDYCGDCSQSTGMVKTWETIPGARIGTAPRFQPYVPTPFRALPFRPAPPSGCYRMRNGSMVHVTPGCRCPK